MSPISALRAKRSPDDLPSMPSDDELLAWSRSLVSGESVEDVDAAPVSIAAQPRRRRTEPLRATRRHEHLGLEDLFEEIERRATAAAHHRPRLAVRRLELESR